MTSHTFCNVLLNVRPMNPGRWASQELPWVAVDDASIALVSARATLSGALLRTVRARLCQVPKFAFPPHPYTETTRWLKIRNKDYSQWAGRHELV